MPAARGPRPLLDQAVGLGPDPSTLGGGTHILSNRCSIVKSPPGNDAHALRSYTRERMSKRIRFRPPGLKPTTKVGTLGPYRGRLGFAWVIAPVFAGVAILLAGWLLLR